MPGRGEEKLNVRALFAELLVGARLEITASVGARLARDGVLEIAIASKLSSHRGFAQGLGSPLPVGARLARDGVLEIVIASKLSSHRGLRKA
ncbi:hypothetical protein CS078_25040 [Pseudomonas prosekii]|uniref:Uncharacterized protein n=1 Tax=Pseudomonas prosekii TaxID=1148509 RepID=A0A3L8CBB9_9PSED|nr:hypothetical protein CS078_25040 [Pseudomonas prosekii]